ncbi:MAG: hypothetical protein LBI88_06690 [Deltaproteobacteria bacterium]|jgi:photosystem II stability/assembly factor-like uncharacterized protein|nr:hypothetical protein [Deltaproteobacteria bacterium]
MKTTARIIVMAALFCAASPTLAGQDTWHKIALDKTHIAFLTSDPARASTLYAASTLGLLKSLDNGASWSALPGLPQEVSPSAVAINSHNSKELYVSYDGLGLFKSVDSGQNWQPVDMGLPNLSIRRIVISPKDPNLIYLGILGGVAVSTNGGKFWHMTSGFKRTVNVNVIVIDPKNPQYLYAGTGGGGVFKSGNGGVSWKDVNEGLSSLSIPTLHIDPENPDILLAGAYHPATPTDLYVGEASGGVYRSQDGGRSWQGSSLLNIHIFSLAASPTYPDVVYAGAWGGVYRSTDKGLNWTDINAGLDNAFVHAVHVLPGKPPTLLAGTTYGLLSYTDAALHVSAGRDRGMEPLIVYGLGGGVALVLLLGFLFVRRRAKRKAQNGQQQPVW